MQTDEEIWKLFHKHMLNEAVSKKRLLKLRASFNTMTRGLQKPISQATREDLEEFVDQLNTDKFNRIDGQKWSGRTKLDIKKFLKQFYKWFKGDNEFYPVEIRWLKARMSKDEIPEARPVLSIDEVGKLANCFNKTELRIMTLLLFDSGFRIQEMLSVKKRDLTWELYDEETRENCFWLKCNESKTFTRKVPVSLFTEDLQLFCNTVYYKELGSDDVLFQISYDHYRKRLTKLGKELFKKDRLTPHALRHSSATYYSGEYDGNMNLISQRYGWSLSSKELKTYIRQSGAYQRQGAKKSYNNELTRLKKENETVFAEIAKLRKTIESVVSGYASRKQRTESILSLVEQLKVSKKK